MRCDRQKPRLRGADDQHGALAELPGPAVDSAAASGLTALALKYITSRERRCRTSDLNKVVHR
jgi:hypothetical protein